MKAKESEGTLIIAMRIFRIFLVTITFLAIVGMFQHASAQGSIQGQITDAESGKTLPFVHVVVDGENPYGTTTNIKGYYSLSIPVGAGNRDVQFSIVGYKQLKLPFVKLAENPDIALTPRVEALDEFVVSAGEDPAYEMIRQAVQNRKKNQPESRGAFRFTSYNKANIDLERNDSTAAALKGTGFENAHFFMMESATEVTFTSPNNWSEKIIASKVSGLKNPMFGLVSNSFQPFTFYDNYVNVLEIAFLNPISPGSASRYQFTLMDSASVAGEKVYIISYRSKSSASEKLLEGMVSLTAKEFAIANITARNTGKNALLIFEIRQAYRPVDGTWFPSESNTVYAFEPGSAEGQPRIETTTFLKDLTILDKSEVEKTGLASVVQTDSAGIQNEDRWRDLRPFDLDSAEANTYLVYDTLPETFINTLNWFSEQSASLSEGRLGLGKVDLLLNHLLRFNQFEGVRLGIGAATNNKLLKWMSIGGYYAYGFNDGNNKYGGFIDFNILPKRDIKLSLAYRNDVDEPGRNSLTSQRGYLKTGENIRSFFTRRMNRVEQFEGTLTYRLSKPLHLKTYALHENRFRERFDILGNDFFQTEVTKASIAGLTISFTPGEELFFVNGKLSPMNFSYPRLKLDLSRALPGVFDSQLEFTRAQFQFEHLFRIRGLGEMRIFGNASKIWADGEITYPYLEYGRGVQGEADFGILATGYFQTMRLYEFLNDEFVQLGAIHNFGSVFGINKKFTKPELKITYQAGIGDLSELNLKDAPPGSQKMDKPYLEGGIIVDNILRMSSNVYYTGYGIGIFYRHGHFAFEDDAENISLILSVAISF